MNNDAKLIVQRANDLLGKPGFEKETAEIQKRVQK